MREPDMAALDALLARCNRTRVTLTPMAGGASTRRYFRLGLADGTTAVAMFVPEGAKPEEIHKDGPGHLARARWPFLEVGELLAARGVVVPAVLGEATDDGWLLIEDLGDDTLANYLLREPAHRELLYRTAVTDLARAQRCLADLPAGSIVATRSFDADLLEWELQHFAEWALDARGVALSASARSTFDACARDLAGQISRLPYGFVHRDYQSRNLMVRVDPATGAPGLVWIDFQDALLGPRVYDLVALLNDSYQSFDRAFVEARLDDYGREAGLSAEERLSLAGEFDRVTVQRKLKDAGRFVFIDRMKGNASFLRFVDSTIAKAKASMARLAPTDATMRELAAVLASVV